MTRFRRVLKLGTWTIIVQIIAAHVPIGRLQRTPSGVKWIEV